MALTEGDKAIIGNISAEMTHKIITEIMPYHIDACPHGKKVTRLKFILVGICVGVCLAGGSGFAGGLLKLFVGL